ncbi:MAG: hypothetical protein QOJ13_299 [Gaiellales bacterium]|nr:hypothetical protein [Gaiellales bacterium]
MKRETADQRQTESEPSNGSGPDDPENPEFDRFEALLKRLVSVPKKELDEKRNGG